MPKVILEVPATVSLQGTIVRSRVPTSALNALVAEDGDAIQWQVQEAGDGLKYIVGTVEKGGAANIQRTPPTPPVRAAKAAAKAAAKKGPAKKGGVLDEFADPAPTADSEDELWADPPKAPAKKAAAAPAKKGGYGVPAAAKAPIPKPSAAKAPAKKAVAYELPASGGGLDEFAD